MCNIIAMPCESASIDILKKWSRVLTCPLFFATLYVSANVSAHGSANALAYRHEPRKARHDQASR